MANDAYSADSEEWRVIADWPRYEVSSHGRVRSLHRREDAILCQDKAKDRERIRVHLSHRGTAKTINVHRLVCLAFHGPAPTPDHEVAHNDGNATNNHYSNLRWSTHADNIDDRFAHGTQKLCREDRLQINELRAAGLSATTVAKLYSIAPRTVFRISKIGRA